MIFKKLFHKKPTADRARIAFCRRFLPALREQTATPELLGQLRESAYAPPCDFISDYRNRGADKAFFSLIQMDEPEAARFVGALSEQQLLGCIGWLIRSEYTAYDYDAYRMEHWAQKPHLRLLLEALEAALAKK